MRQPVVCAHDWYGCIYRKVWNIIAATHTLAVSCMRDPRQDWEAHIPTRMWSWTGASGPAPAPFVRHDHSPPLSASSLSSSRAS